MHLTLPRVILGLVCSFALHGANASVFIVPYFIDKFDGANTTYTLDTIFRFTYAAGQNGISGGAGATVDLYLFDNSGNALQGISTAVCAPCSYNLSSSQRQFAPRVEDLIVAAGGFQNSTVVGYAMIVVSGADPNGVRIGSSIKNAKTNADDVSIEPLVVQKLGMLDTPAKENPPWRHA